MIRIGNAQVSLERREAFLDGKPIPLGGRAFEVLATLIRANGRVVGKDELFSQVWAGTVVEDNNLQVQAALARLALPWPIVFMTGFGTIPMTVQAMRAGAVEFLTKPFDEDQLLALLESVRARAVSEGRKWRHARQVEEKYQRLTQRERQVFSLVAGGLSHKQIAREIGTSEVTTKVHKKNIMNKMQSRSLLELVAMHNVIEARSGA